MKVFSDDELAQMGRRTVDVLVEAIESGDIEKSKKLAYRMHRESQSNHDMYLNWLTAIVSYIGKNFGDDKIVEAQREGVAAWLRPNWEAVKGKDFRKQAEMFASGLRGHLGGFKMEEDDEKVTYTMEPACPSGGRLARGETGYKDFLWLSRPSPTNTYNKTNYPAYCTQCPAHDLLYMEWIGYPFFYTEQPPHIGEKPCRQHIYKDPAKIPASVYERVGKKKPAA